MPDRPLVRRNESLYAPTLRQHAARATRSYESLGHQRTAVSASRSGSPHGQLAITVPWHTRDR